MIAVNAVKKNNSPLFTAFLTKIHHQIHRISYQNSPHRLLWKINVRNAVNAVNRGELFFFTAFSVAVNYPFSPLNAMNYFFSPHFTAFLTKIHRIWFPKFTQSELNSQEITKKQVTVGAGE